jgi:hypothetical protein
MGMRLAKNIDWKVLFMLIVKMCNDVLLGPGVNPLEGSPM